MYTQPKMLGLTVPIPSQFSSETISGHEMIFVPGGLTIMGSVGDKFNPPRWVKLSSFYLAKEKTSEGQFSQIMGRQGNVNAPANFPASMIARSDAMEYIYRLNIQNPQDNKLSLPTWAQWEYAVKGWPVNVNKEVNRIAGTTLQPGSREWIQIASSSFENLFFSPLGQIFNETVFPFTKLLKEFPVWGYYTFAARQDIKSQLPKNEDLNKRFMFPNIEPVHQGIRAPYGNIGMIGGAWEYVSDLFDKRHYKLRLHDEDMLDPEGQEVTGNSHAYAVSLLSPKYSSQGPIHILIDDSFIDMSGIFEPKEHRSSSFRVAAKADH